VTASPQHSLPKACDDWADLKAAYRFLSNPRVNAEAIQTPHRRHTRARCAEHPVVLCVEDISELDFTTRRKTRGLGPIGDGRGRGLLQHSTLAVTPQGNVLGLLHQQWITRAEVPEAETREQRRARFTKTDLWSEAVAAVGSAPSGCRLVHVADREADCFQVMQACDDHGVGFLIRAQHNRSIHGGTDKLWSFMIRQRILGPRVLKLPRTEKRTARTARLNIRCGQVLLDPPARDDRFTQPRRVSAVYLTEERSPKDAEAVEWMLLTSEPTTTAEEAFHRVDEYSRRWVIEEFHKVEKTGCRLEASQLDEAADLQRLAAIVAVAAVRLLMLREKAQTAMAGETQDPAVLQRSVPWLWIVVVALADKKDPVDPATLTPRAFWLRIARQGGYIGRRSDGRPGWSTAWKGWYDFMFMFRGAELMIHPYAQRIVGKD